MMTDDEVSVKRIFEICVNLYMIYMLRMHWSFLIEFYMAILNRILHVFKG